MMYRKAASSDIPQALYSLAYFYQNGIVVSKNETTAVVYDTGVTVIDGSAENFDITAYELTGFDASGFNTEYFTVTETDFSVLSLKLTMEDTLMTMQEKFLK